MAWYKNIETNIVWEIVGDFEKQISANPVFEKVAIEEDIKEAEQEPKVVKAKQSKK